MFSASELKDAEDSVINVDALILLLLQEINRIQEENIKLTERVKLLEKKVNT